VNGESVASIDSGLLVLAAVEKGDSERAMRDAAKKSASCASSAMTPAR